MKTYFVLFGIILFVLVISIIGLNIKYLLSGKPLEGSCASNNKLVRDKFGNCTVCGRVSSEVCESESNN